MFIESATLFLRVVMWAHYVPQNKSLGATHLYNRALIQQIWFVFISGVMVSLESHFYAMLF